MPEKINVTGALPRRIVLTDRPARRVDPAAFGAAIDAEPCAGPHTATTEDEPDQTDLGAADDRPLGPDSPLYRP